MNMMPVTDAAKAALRDALAIDLEPAEIVRIEVTPDHDQDGDEILWVIVVLDDSKVTVDGERLLKASVNAQAALGAANDSRFAVIDFVSATDTVEAIE